MSLKAAHSLEKFLTDDSHQTILITDYMDTVFSISSILKKIVDFKFFYGISDFSGKDSAELFSEAYPTDLNKHFFRISPDALSFLYVFIERANQVFVDYQNRSGIFKSAYFKKDLLTQKPSHTQGSTSPILKIIGEYLNDFEQHKNIRKTSK